MTDRLWGSHISNEDMPFAVGYGQGYSGGVVGNGAVGSIGMGSYTMPWYGNLSAHVIMSASWPQSGHQQWYIHLGHSSPGPTTNSVLTEIGMNNLGLFRGQLPCYAQWQNLAKGTVVNFGLAVGVGGGGWNLTVEWWGITIRAWPA
jgi:hypothetical protein